MAEQPPLFDVPAPPPRRVARASSGAGRPRYQRYRPARRRLCDDCIAAIHVLGVGGAPLPRTVRWRCVDADVVALLCDAHKSEREDE